MTASSIDHELLAILERAFAEHAGDDAAIDLADLQRALRVRNEYFARRMLAVLDRDGDGVVKKHEFLEGVRALVAGTDEDKLRFAFRLHDHDDNGSLDRDELLRMIVVSLAESESTERVTQTAEQLVAALLKKVDADRDGRISFDELLAFVRTRPKLLAQMVRHEAIWIAPNEELLDWLDKREGVGVVTSGRGWGAPIALAAFVLGNLGLFASVLLQGLSLEQKLPTVLTRALARCVDLDGALILVPVMRRLLTKVRATALGRVLPIDDAIDFHKIVGHTMFGLAVAHTVTAVWGYVEGHPDVVGLVQHRVGLTGAALLVVFLVMWVFSLSFIRRGQRFELFYFTHLLYVAWFALAIVHGPRFLLWAGAALLGFVLEQLWRAARTGIPTRVVVAEPMRSGVVNLQLERSPKMRKFEPSDYVFLRIPAIAKREWHPFTISSAPEKPYLGFHVRALGNWTRALRAHVEERRSTRDPRPAFGGSVELTAYVDGPYGSPSQHIFESKHVVLIGAGIGVTPFASVLESLVMRSNGESQRPSSLRHVHFFWLNRDQYSFEWFGALLRELEERDAQGLLQIHLCMTGGRAGATALGLELARDVMKSQGRSDFFTGLRTHTHLGQPDWESMLRAIAQQHAPEQVDVYFCGPPGLAKKIRPIAQKLGMTFREEKF